MRGTTIHGRVAGLDGSSAFFQPWQELPAAIVRRAADDYIEVTRKLWKSGQSLEDKRLLLKDRIELEQFFYSEWYEFLCDVPAKRLLHSCISRAKELEKESIERKNKQEVKRLLKGAV